jgi:hypothetical protein
MASFPRGNWIIEIPFSSQCFNQLLILILGVLAQIHLVLLVLVVVAQMPRPGDGSKTHVFAEVQGFESKSNSQPALLDGLVFNYGKIFKGSILHFLILCLHIDIFFSNLTCKNVWKLDIYYVYYSIMYVVDCLPFLLHDCCMTCTLYFL